MVRKLWKKSLMENILRLFEKSELKYEERT